MNSLVGYDSDVDSNEISSSQAACKDSSLGPPQVGDTNYESIEMDESDQEMNNNVEEYYSADVEEGVNPEDAPLVFRTVSEPRNNIRTTILHRNSSDMEVDDGEADAEAYYEYEEDVLGTTTAEKNIKKGDENAALTTKASENENKRGAVEKPKKLPKEHMDERSAKQDKPSRSSDCAREDDDHVDGVLSSHSQCPENKVANLKGSSLQKKIDVSKRDTKRESARNKRNSERSEGKEEGGSVAKTPASASPASARVYCSPSIKSRLRPSQVVKKKLVWTKKAGNETVATGTWNTTVFKNDSDGKMAEKFKRLMGIRNSGKVDPGVDEKVEVLERQEEMFSNMEAQYQQARLATHMQRGLGLGYGATFTRSNDHVQKPL